MADSADTASAGQPGNLLSSYASYDWIGSPSNFSLATNALTGGDSRTENVNKWFQPGDQAFIIVASAMVLIMVPGLAFLYAGLARRKSALSLMWACMVAGSVVTLQWYIWGYSLAFSITGNSGFIGDLHHIGLKDVLAAPSVGSPLVPALLFAFYQMQFCAVTGAIIAGAVAERGRLIPFCVWLFLWATLVYAPIAYWVWNPNGWAYKWGVLDYAGGGPVEIGSALSAFAYAMVLGRRNETMMLNFRPHNVSMILLGTILLWFGWLGFNGGSSYGANLRAVMACWNSNITATFSAFTWMLLDYRLSRKWSMVGWCSGTISGLVAATPASGFITTWGSAVLGISTGLIANYATKVKYWVKIDDSLDIFAEHGVPGMVGLIFNALFGADYIIGLDGVNTGLQNTTTGTAAGGFLNKNYRQFYIQLAYVVTCSVYAFSVSMVLAYMVNYIPGLHLRASEEAELLGMDDAEVGEFAYDYVEIRRDFLAWTPGSANHENGIDPESMDEQRYGIAEHVAMAKSYSAKKASVDVTVNDADNDSESVPSTEKVAR